MARLLVHADARLFNELIRVDALYPDGRCRSLLCRGVVGGVGHRIVSQVGRSVGLAEQ